MGAGRNSVVECLFIVLRVTGSNPPGGAFSFLKFQPVLHNWCNKGGLPFFSHILNITERILSIILVSNQIAHNSFLCFNSLFPQLIYSIIVYHWIAIKHIAYLNIHVYHNKKSIQFYY